MKHLFLCLLLAVTTVADDKKEKEKEEIPAVRFDPILLNIEGWKVHVDPALLDAGKEKELGDKALRMLADRLNRIAILVPPDRLKQLRTLEIWIEHKHPRLGAMQYHPSIGWLKSNNHDPRLEKKVHIPHAKALIDRGQLVKHPMVVLHELAHAYHDQYLSFDNKEIIDVYEQARKSGSYDKVMLFTGRTVKHYGMTNHKEYFAEGTEAYFGRNDFYPFVRAELAEHDPDFHALLSKIWGPVK